MHIVQAGLTPGCFNIDISISVIHALTFKKEKIKRIIKINAPNFSIISNTCTWKTGKQTNKQNHICILWCNAYTMLLPGGRSSTANVANECGFSCTSIYPAYRCSGCIALRVLRQAFWDCATYFEGNCFSQEVIGLFRCPSSITTWSIF